MVDFDKKMEAKEIVRDMIGKDYSYQLDVIYDIYDPSMAKAVMIEMIKIINKEGSK